MWRLETKPTSVKTSLKQDVIQDAEPEGKYTHCHYFFVHCTEQWHLM